MQRTIMELNEIPCIPLETEIASKQQARLMTCFAGTSNFNPNAASFTSAAVKLAAPTALPRHLHQAPAGALEGPPGRWRSVRGAR